MNTKNRLMIAGTAAMLSLGLAGGVNAQDAAGQARVGDTEIQGSIQTDRPAERTTADRDRGFSGALGDRQTTTTFGTANQPVTVSKVNKASDLVGMKVRNHQNENLGDIKDLVVDLQSGKIAYAVLSVGGFLGIGEKLLAVPPSAFTVGTDHDTLVLNADKNRIENAPGFARNNWPDLNSPTWQTESAYWLPGNVGQGTAGGTRTGTDTSVTPDPSRTTTESDSTTAPIDR